MTAVKCIENEPMESSKKNTALHEEEVSCITPLHKTRNRTKAEVYLVTHKDSKIVFKDFRKTLTLIRLTYGRYSLYREAKAYSRLEGIFGVPRCFGLDGRDVLKLEFIKGQPLSRSNRGNVPESVFGQLKKIISAMHARGVANGDLHRSNVLLTSDGDVYLVDYANSFFTDPEGKPGFIFRVIMDLDWFAFERMKAKYLCLEAPSPKGFFGVCYTFCITIKKIKKRLF
jgi:RIO-like serine/threonine protein kinase